ncbi:MAG: hypothetical protein PHO27_02280 [Sulfuricurvum sp.]|nr:hypothetical protein [Sulfuricurvum sp.]
MDQFSLYFGVAALLFILFKYVTRKLEKNQKDNENDEDCDID